MKHLSDEQLSAKLDGELAGKRAEEADRHLAACAECRERLAALAGADAALAHALEHDPGEAYFGSFAGRVQARLGAAGGAREARPADAAPRRGWLSRPSTLAWAGTAAAVVVVGAFALRFVIEPDLGANRSATPSPAAGERQLAAPPPSAGEAAPPAAESREGSADQGAAGGPAGAGSRFMAPPAAKAPAPAASALKQEAASPEGGARRDAAAAPQRMQEVRTLPNGEQAPVRQKGQPSAPAPSFAAPPSSAAKIRKPGAAPASPAPAPGPVEEKVVVTPPAALGEARSNEATTGLSRAEADEAPTFRLCGTVKNSQGRAVAGATVTVVQTGHSTVSASDGSFCIAAPSSGATLAVLSLGYQEYRASVGPVDAASSYAVALQSVDALGQGGLAAGRLKTAPPPAEIAKSLDDTSGKAKAGEFRYQDRLAPAGANLIPALPGETPDATAARLASEAAMRANSAPLWSKAGALWTSVAANARSDAMRNEALYRAAEARVSAWRLERGAADLRSASEAVDAFLAKAPAGPRRTQAERWRGELTAR